jgi:hypothetical protein
MYGLKAVPFKNPGLVAGWRISGFKFEGDVEL